MEKSGISPSQNIRELGLAAADAGKWTEALIYLNRAARQGYTDVAILDALGEAAYEANVPEALGPFQNHYKYPSLATHMARAFLMLGDAKSCSEFLGYAKESALKDALQAMLNIGDEISETVENILPVAERYPGLRYPQYWRALSAVADAVGREDLVRLSEQRSKQLAYSDPNIHFNQALRMLGKGEFRAGWRLYEWRLVPNASQSNRTELGKISMWEGESLQGKSLLVYLEQGLGDGIFALRYIQMLSEQASRLEIVARPTLIPLIQATFSNVKVHNEDEAVVVGYWDQIPLPDYWVYGLSIPFRSSTWRPFNTTKFLSVSQSLLNDCQNKIKALNISNLPVFTVNWHGRIDTASDRTRAFSVAEFSEVSGILRQPSVVISLQKDATTEEIATLKELVVKSGGKFIDAGPELSDFGVTAAWISASDRLLTCDTSVAHVGGSLGHPTTVYARNKAIWQWLCKDRAQTDGQTTHSETMRPAVWYDSVFVQYALAPKISWLFTTFQKPKEQSDGRSKDENLEVSKEQLPTSGRRGKFNFAGRSK